MSVKHGFGEVLPLIAAWMQVENKEHFVFFLLSMKSMGFGIENIPFMIDRGDLLSVVRFLYQTTNIAITVKFCTEHIIRNIVLSFSILKTKQC